MIQPLGARVLIKRLPVPETTQSGLYILGREFPACGEVLAIGTGIRKKSRRLPIPDLEVGDKVTFQWRDAFLDTRQVAPDTFILDYEICQAGMREVDGKMMIWPLHGFMFVRRPAAKERSNDQTHRA